MNDVPRNFPQPVAGTVVPRFGDQIGFIPVKYVPFEESPAGLTVDCDGRWHTTRYELRPSTWGDFGDFHDGEVLVQFCLFDSTATEDGAEGFAFDYAMTPVLVP